jgi:hypothetical protein
MVQEGVDMKVWAMRSTHALNGEAMFVSSCQCRASINSNPRLRHEGPIARGCDGRTTPWLAVVVAILSGCTAPTDEASQVVTSAVGSPLCDPTILGGAEIAPGVKYYDCTARLLFDVRAHIVTIDRSLPATEIRLLTDPASDALKASRDKPLDQFWLNLRQVDFAGRRAGASAAINGFVWDGDSGKRIPFIEPENPIGIPGATVYINHELQNTDQQENQVLLGFTQGGPQGIGVKRIPKAEEFEPDNLPFQYQMYASGTNVIKDGVCQNDEGSSVPYLHVNDRWSIVGYSDTHVVFLSATDDANFQQDFCPILQRFGVQNAVRQDGGHSPSLYLGGNMNRVVNTLGSDCGPNDPLACTVPVVWNGEFGAVPRVAWSLGVVPSATVTTCTQLIDSAAVVFGMLCITPDNTGYDVQFITLDGGPARCGLFDFNLVSKDGVRFTDDGAFQACTNDPQSHSFYFRTGTLGGCAVVQLIERSGDDFGKTEWEQSACGFTPPGGGPGPGPVDTTPPVTTATLPDANSHGWHNGNVTIQFSATDPGEVSSGVRAIHVSFTGAQSGTTVISGAAGSVTVSAEGTTRVTYFAIDRAGNVETAHSLVLNLDKTPPSIAGMPGADCSLWPPNHTMVDVATVSASDALSGVAAFDVSGESNEPANNKEPDVVITGSGLDPRAIQLRAERSGHGDGRVYTLTATATDEADNVATVHATCTVAHDQGN